MDKFLWILKRVLVGTYRMVKGLKISNAEQRLQDKVTMLAIKSEIVQMLIMILSGFIMLRYNFIELKFIYAVSVIMFVCYQMSQVYRHTSTNKKMVIITSILVIIKFYIVLIPSKLIISLYAIVSLWSIIVTIFGEVDTADAVNEVMFNKNEEN